MFDDVHAFTTDINPVFSPDITTAFKQWDPFEYMLRNYRVGDYIILPYTTITTCRCPARYTVRKRRVYMEEAQIIRRAWEPRYQLRRAQTYWWQP